MCLTLQSMSSHENQSKRCIGFGIKQSVFRSRAFDASLIADIFNNDIEYMKLCILTLMFTQDQENKIMEVLEGEKTKHSMSVVLRFLEQQLGMIYPLQCVSIHQLILTLRQQGKSLDDEVDCSVLVYMTVLWLKDAGLIPPHLLYIVGSGDMTYGYTFAVYISLLLTIFNHGSSWISMAVNNGVNVSCGSMTVNISPIIMNVSSLVLPLELVCLYHKHHNIACNHEGITQLLGDLQERNSICSPFTQYNYSIVRDVIQSLDTGD